MVFLLLVSVHQLNLYCLVTHFFKQNVFHNKKQIVR